MAKYSFEFKLELVKDYLSGDTGGYKTIAKKYGVKAGSQVEHWIKNYEKQGEEGLQRLFTLENLSYLYYNIGNTIIDFTEKLPIALTLIINL